MINEYANRAAHDAATRSSTESEVSIALDTRECLVDGVNVKISLSPKVGDIVCHDADNAVRFIALDTYKSLPDGWEVMGVVAHRQGKELLIVYKTQETRKFCPVFQYVVSGYELDGISHSGAAKIHGTDVGAFTYTATSKAQFKAQLAAFVEANAPEDFSYSVHEDSDGNVILQLDTYAASQGVHSIAGLTLTENVAHELPIVNTVPRYNGNASYWAGLCLKKFYDRYSAGGATPESEVSLTDTNVVNEQSFLTSEFCSLLRERYCANPTSPTADDYMSYIKANMARAPYTRGIMAEPYRDGKRATYLLASATYEDADGETQIKYPAAAYAASVGFAGVEGFEFGDWFIPSVAQFAEVIRELTLGGAGISGDAIDPINRSLAAAGGRTMPCSSGYWFVGRFSASSAWGYSGSSGSAGSYSFYSGLGARPVVLYTLA